MEFSKRSLAVFISVMAGVLLVIVAAALVLQSFSPERRYSRYYEEARLSYQDRDWRRAQDALERAMELDDTEESYLLLAEVYASSGDLDSAVSTLYTASLKYESPEIAERLSELKEQQSENNSGTGNTVSIGGEAVPRDETSLILLEKGLSSVDLTPLSELTALQSLTLKDNNITDLSALSALKKLSFLHLGGNPVSDLTPLASLPELKTLYLDGNPVDDLTPLYGLKKLRTLSLRDIPVGSNELEALQEALPDCYVFCDDVLEEPKEITLGDITFKSDVTELDLSGQELTELTALSSCAALTRLDLSHNKISDLTPLADLKELTWLCLWDNSIEDIGPLLTLPKLYYLDLDQNQITDIATLGELPTLEELWLSHNRPESFEPLRGLTKLRRLGLNDTGFGDVALEFITPLTSLTELNLEDNEAFTAEGLEKLQEALPNCTLRHSPLYFTVTLGGQVYTSDMTAIHLEGAGVSSLLGLDKFSLLSSLILNSNSIPDLTPLSGLAGLEILELGDNKITDVAPLKKLTALKRLILNKNKIEDISPLSALRELTYLNLEDNRISDPTPLYALTKLRTLYIGKNESLSAEQLIALQEALPECSIQTDLDLTPPSPEETPAP